MAKEHSPKLCGRERLLTLAVYIGLSLFWFAVLCNPAVHIDGFDKEDDHQICGIARESFHSPFRDILRENLRSDVGMRLRPLWWVWRTGLAYVSGGNFVVFSIANAVLAAVTSILLLIFARRLGASVVTGVLFSLCCMLGPQVQCYIWRAPQESLGSFLLAIGLASMAGSVYSARHRRFHFSVFVLAVIAMGLVKESFVILLPAIIFWRTWLFRAKHCCSWRSAAVGTLWTNALLVLVGGGLLFCVLRFVGASSGYAGLDRASQAYLEKIARAFLVLTGSGRLETVCFAIGAVVLWRVGERFRVAPQGAPPLMDLAAVCVLMALWILPQILLYAKSGIGDRYLLPGMIGLFASVLWVAVYSSSRFPYLCLQLNALAAILAVVLFVQTVGAVRFYGTWRMGWVQVIDDVRRKASPQSRIFAIIDPSEDYGYGKNVFDYLTGLLRFPAENVYVHFEPPPPYTNDKENRTHKMGVMLSVFRGNTLDKISDLRSMDMVIMRPQSLPRFAKQPRFATAYGDYMATATQSYVHFVKRNVGR